MQSEQPPPMPFDVDLSILTIGAERVSWLSALLTTARNDFQPRDFAERHLVDEMAFNKWRILRIYAMEKAVYEQQRATFSPKGRLTPDGRRAEPHEDQYHLAQALLPDNDGLILAALSRLEARFHRQFCSALKMLITLRRFNPTGKDNSPWTPSSPSAKSSEPVTTSSPNNLSPPSSPSDSSNS